VIDRLAADGPEARRPVGDESMAAIAPVYNRLLYVRPTPRLGRALSTAWDPAVVEDRYLGEPPGIVVVDDLLTPEALEAVRRFCVESTVWSANRYAHGRLGAFLQDGFNCPLLLQVAEELRDALPRVIGDRYPLRQLWGFKCAPELPPDATTHADFAAVNVNFWVTPDDANLDPSSGGMVIYDVDAPRHWDFDTYNGRPEIIAAFLQRQGSRALHVPYRQNRAVIFNSDLLHGTSAVHFRPDYEARRVNVTLLYGDRRDDVHHHTLARPELLAHPRADGPRPAWRSAAFARARSTMR
jgi:hypothetical protein